MANTCLTCTHPKRLEIDRRLVKGHGYAALARQFQLPMTSIRNHAQKHLSRQIAVTYSRIEMTESTQLMEKLHEMIENGQAIFNRNFERGRDGTALKAIDSMRLVWELITKIYAYVAEVRRLEQDAERASIESRIEEESAEFLQEAMSRLNNAELLMLDRLVKKASGQTDEVIIPDQVSPFSDITYDVKNPELRHDQYATPEPDRNWIDSDKDFADLPPKPKMRRTK